MFLFKGTLCVVHNQVHEGLGVLKSVGIMVHRWFVNHRNLAAQRLVTLFENGGVFRLSVLSRVDP